jgi:hypothetical protein
MGSFYAKNCDEEGYMGDGSRQVKAFHKQVLFVLFRLSSSRFIAKKTQKYGVTV